MERNKGLANIRPNTIEEHTKLLQQLKNERQASIKRKDYKKLFIKLNGEDVSMSYGSLRSQSPQYYNKNVAKAIYGPIPGIPPGSWWGIRMDCSRDRVHDPFDANIQIGPVGVTSICTSDANEKEDVDLGDFLTITGQQYVDGTSETDPLIINYKKQIPLRLIRSYNLTNPFAPRTGYRYDGLYIVIAHWIGVCSDATKYHKFALANLGDCYSPAACCNKTSISKATNILCKVRNLPHTLRMDSSDSYKNKFMTKEQYKDNSNVKVLNTTSHQPITLGSTIVTRHVFKKPVNVESLNGQRCSMSDQKVSAVQTGVRTSTTHSTNIAVRTGLYDSSHNIQDIRKQSLVSCCKMFKPSFKYTMLQQNLLRQSNAAVCHSKKDSIASTTDSKTSTTAGLKKDKILTQTKIQPAKHIRWCLNSNTESEATQLSALDTELLLSYTADEIQSDITPSNTAVNSCNIDNSLVTQVNNLQAKHPTFSEKTFQSDKSCKSADTDYKKVLHQTKSVTVLSKEANSNNFHLDVKSQTDPLPTDILSSGKEVKSLETLESLTPDKILSMINKGKSNPLSKLLIDNVIGFASEESTVLKGYNDTEKKCEGNNETKENIDTTYEGLLNENNKKFSKPQRHGLPFRKVVKGCEKGDRKILDNCQMTNAAIKSERVIDKKFAKRFIKATVKNHTHKKIRREIANLSINIKIGPKIRGPRNRRLRYINNMCARKRCCSSFGNIISTSKKSKDTEKKGIHKQGFTKRSKSAGSSPVKKEISSRQTKNIKCNISVQSDIKKRKKSGYDVIHKINANDKNNNDQNNKSQGTQESKIIKIDAKNDNTMQLLTNRKRAMVQTDSQEILHATRTKRLCYFQHNPDKVDVMTQCSLPSELSPNATLPSTNIRDTGYSGPTTTKYRQKQPLFKTTNSSFYESVNFRHLSHSLDKTSDRLEKNYQGIKCRMRYLKDTNVTKGEYKQSMEQRASAFVPVNTLDNDSRIARLRSIDFKPITLQLPSDKERLLKDDIPNERIDTKTSKVIKRDVAEEYNKYTSDENDVVVYMDEKLRYQDIENEAVSSSNMKNICTNALYEQDFEAPWHGWKEVVTNKKSYWIGW